VGSIAQNPGRRISFAFSVDNRPLNFEEFDACLNQVVYVSRHPPNTMGQSNGAVVEPADSAHRLHDPEVVIPARTQSG
jgi:excinuclease ABC subunit B